MKRLLLALFVLASCKKEGDKVDSGTAVVASASVVSMPSASATSVTVDGACKLTDACLVLTKEDAESVLGFEVKAGEHGSGDTKLGKVTVSTCSYQSSAHGKPRLSAMMRCGPHTDTDLSGVKKTFSGLMYTTIQDVSGVGDLAAWGSRVQGGTTSGQLDVYKSANVYIIAHVHGYADDASALAAAKKVASLSLAKL